ncbi:hypothetical protein HYDPIDRAFT_169352 [Hydnomerulius pinastri MD-312]|uniref:Uncharacterized protein n=1 Tax=Hydnomerulius pinastri MD-312 TaxID=994086 RepID=A0A0C9WCW0_9AGAM|nr:hypothetical protein HYDPIDRAFT_169352 [Hydnomerulius pinastri MD-312]
MPDNLRTGTCNIRSLTEGEPYIGIPLTRPNAVPVIALPSVPVYQWDITKVGEYKYLLGIYTYIHTRLENKSIFAFTEGADQEWYITYKENKDAYTIGIKDDGTGWTVPVPLEGVGPRYQVEVAPIVSTHSLPPQVSAAQLFRFEYAS